MTDSRLAEIAIIGRPNVGKSTLFNRMVGRRQAIVGQQSGLTRDRHRAEAEWCGHRFIVTDTGGVEWGATEELLQLIRRQAFSAVDTADLVLYVVDGRDGLVPVEEELAAELRRRDLPVVLVVNKCDRRRGAEDALSDFRGLGLDPAHAVSAEHGVGVGDLLDTVVGLLPDLELVEEPPDGAIRVAVVGRPNVGKSSLVNALLGAERVIVSEIAGTTRDAIDTLLEHDGREYRLIDTAGIRRGGKRDTFAENVSVAIARKRMQRADVALMVVDGLEGLSRQDVTIAAEAGKAGCGLVVVVNKWDLVDSRGHPPKQWLAELRERMGRIGFATFAFTSALTGHGVEKLLPLVDQVQRNRTRRVPTAEVNALFERIQRRGTQAPPGAARPKYLTQVSVAPPTFVVFVRGRGEVPAAYRRYYENRLREAFDFEGAPLVVRVRKGGSREAPPRT